MITVFKRASYRRNLFSVALLVLLAAVSLTNPNNVSRAADSTQSEAPPERTLRFPEDPSWLPYAEGKAYSVRLTVSSRLAIRDWNPENFEIATDLVQWHDHGEALGTVTIPAGKELKLEIVSNPWDGLGPLADLPPDTFHAITIWNRFNKEGEQWISRSDLRILAGQRSLKSLLFLNRPLSDDLLAELPAMTSLRKLSLEGAQITDAAMPHIAAMPWLESLNLAGTLVTDVGLIYLEDMTALRSLSLDRTDVGDAGLECLRNLVSLETLSLKNTKVTDAGLAHLKNLAALRELKTTNSLVTAAGLDSLPNLVPSATEPFVRGQIRVGMILSHYQATGPSSLGTPYTYNHQKQVLQQLVDCGFDIYAIIDPGSRELGELPIILKNAGIEDVVIENTDRAALEGLDVIVSAMDYNIHEQTVALIRDVIRTGVGFINFSVLGSKTPGSNNRDIQEIIGIENGQYQFRPKEVVSTVLERHPILGPLEVGDPFTFHWVDGLAGRILETPLLAAPDGIAKEYVPLYVRQLGQGRIINQQWMAAADQIRDFSAEDFMTRCILWAAKFPLD